MTKVIWGLVGGLFFYFISEELRGWLDRIPRAVLRLAAGLVDRGQRKTIYEDVWVPELAHRLLGTESRPITRLVKGMGFAIGRLISEWRTARYGASAPRPQEATAADTALASEPWPAFLLPDEEQVMTVRRHPAVLFVPFSLAFGGLIAAGLLTGSVAQGNSGVLGVIWIVWGLLFAQLIWKTLNWSVGRLTVTSQRIQLTYGVVRRGVASVLLAEVTDMVMRRSLLGRVFGYGDFLFEFAGQEHLNLVDHIPHPENFYQQLLDLIFPNKDNQDDK
jgi:hypothetical protein